MINLITLEDAEGEKKKERNTSVQHGADGGKKIFLYFISAFLLPLRPLPLHLTDQVYGFLVAVK